MHPAIAQHRLGISAICQRYREAIDAADPHAFLWPALIDSAEVLRDDLK
jgi:hypothetical protein